MKSKFAGLNFDTVEVLSKEQQRKVMGGDGYGGGGSYTGTGGGPNGGGYPNPGGPISYPPGSPDPYPYQPDLGPPGGGGPGGNGYNEDPYTYHCTEEERAMNRC